jgi:X-Pro dipeptidyl-peptidase
VYVESDYDTDLDGKCDLIKVYVQVPRAAVLSGVDGWKAPVLYEARPYNGGMATHLDAVMGFDATELNDDALATKPAKRVATSSMNTAQLAGNMHREVTELRLYEPYRRDVYESVGSRLRDGFDLR